MGCKGLSQAPLTNAHHSSGGHTGAKSPTHACGGHSRPSAVPLALCGYPFHSVVPLQLAFIPSLRPTGGLCPHHPADGPLSRLSHGLSEGSQHPAAAWKAGPPTCREHVEAPGWQALAPLSALTCDPALPAASVAAARRPTHSSYRPSDSPLPRHPDQGSQKKCSAAPLEAC